METILEFLTTILPSIVAFAAAVVSGVAISSNRRTKITSTYYTETAKAYRNYLDSVWTFVYYDNFQSRDRLTSALYAVGLFSSDTVFSEAQDIYVKLLDWHDKGRGSPFAVDKATNHLGSLMRNHLKTFDHR